MTLTYLISLKMACDKVPVSLYSCVVSDNYSINKLQCETIKKQRHFILNSNYLGCLIMRKILFNIILVQSKIRIISCDYSLTVRVCIYWTVLKSVLSDFTFTAGMRHVSGINIYTPKELEAVNGTSVRLKCTFTSTATVSLQSVIVSWNFRPLNSPTEESVCKTTFLFSYVFF